MADVSASSGCPSSVNSWHPHGSSLTGSLESGPLVLGATIRRETD